MVAAGLTFVEPLADVDVKVPGVMAMLVAPVTAQLSELLEPGVMSAGLAVKVLMAGLLCAAVTVTVCVEVTDPAAFVAVRVYVVVAAGLMLAEPLAAVEVKVPGVMAMLVAPETDQLSLLLDPEAMLAGFAMKEAICGAVPCGAGVLWEVAAAQPARAAQQMSVESSAQTPNPGKPRLQKPDLLMRIGFGECMAAPSVAAC